MELFFNNNTDVKITGIRRYYVYLISNEAKTRFTSGVTVDLEGLLQKKGDKELTAGSDCSGLVYFEYFEDVLEAVEREIVINAYSVKKKQALADSFNKNLLPENFLKLIL